MIKDAVLKGACGSSALKIAFFTFLYVMLLFASLRFRVPTFVVVGAWGSFALLGLFGPSYFMRKVRYVGDESGYSLAFESRRARVMRGYMCVMLGVGSFALFISSILAESQPDFQPILWILGGWVAATIVPVIYWVLRLNFVNKELESNANNNFS